MYFAQHINGTNQIIDMKSVRGIDFETEQDCINAVNNELSEYGKNHYYKFDYVVKSGSGRRAVVVSEHHCENY